MQAMKELSLEALANQAKITVIGVGGAGNNAIMRMYKDPVPGVTYLMANTDNQVLKHAPLPDESKILLGPKFTQGLGSGADPERGQKAAEESREEIEKHLKGSDLVFLCAGMGKGTGTGASPIVAEVARNLKAMVVSVVTTPFMLEGKRRMEMAEAGIERLKPNTNSLVVVPNENLLRHDPKMTLLAGFQLSDSVVSTAVHAVSELISKPGMVNVDFADVRAVLSVPGTCLVGIGVATGANRGLDAAMQAVQHSLLDSSIEGAKGVVINITGGPDLSMEDIQVASSAISDMADPDANIIWGAVIDENMKDQIKVTAIATGFTERPLFRAPLRRTAHSAPPVHREEDFPTDPRSGLPVWRPR